MAAQNTVTSATNFLDSIGINTHSGFGTGSYDNSALVLDSLKYIGVDLVRDAYVSVGEAAPVVDALAAAGVKFDFVVSSNLPAAGSAALASYVSSLQAFQEAHPGSIFAIEGLNEVNLQPFAYEGSSSMTAAASFQEALYGAVKGNAGLSDIPVINLSVGNDDAADYAAVGNLAAYSNYANVHAYTNTSNSADATMESSIALASSAAVGDGVIVTETGYTTLQSFNYLGVSETAQAKLVLDNLLNAYENGASKTFLYELFDNSSASTSDSEQHFGIFNADGTPKLAATALHNMTTILSYQGAGSADGTSTDFQLGNMPSDAHSMTMTKADGVYDIVLWTDSTVWNDSTDTDVVNAPTTISVSLGSTQSDVYVYDPLKGTTPIAVYHNVSSINVPLSDSPLIIEVGSQTAVVDSTSTAVDANLTMTTADLVTSLSTLEHAAGLQTITLTDGTDLHVSSVSTMQYMISEYKDALAKIQGSFTFSVENGQATWQESQIFDSTGKLLSTTDSSISNGVTVGVSTVWADGSTENTSYKAGVIAVSRAVAVDGTLTTINYNASGKPATELVQVPKGDTTTTTFVNGVISSVTIKHIDGTAEYQAYNLTGRTYTTQVQVVDAKGAVVSVVRSHADGSLDYSELHNADGSKDLTYYDATGHKLTEALTAAAGTRTTLTYDAAGNVSKNYVQTTDGGTSLTLYANGIKTSLAVTATSGAKSYTVYASNGSLVSQSATTAAGDVTNTTYANGIKTSVNIAHVDGSHENYAYGITGQTYTTQYQSFDTSSHLLSLVRSHADGSLDSTETDSADGSKAYTYYTATGVKLTNVTVAASGTRTTLTYDAAGNVSKDYIQTTDGGTSLTLYANSIKTSLAVTATSGAKSYTVYGSTGAIVSQSVTTATGDVTNTTYANGIKTSVNIAHADGSHENYAYGITGQTYTTQYQSFNASGHLLSLVRSHANGSLDSTETDSADGSKAYTYYTATGVKLTNVQVAAGGNRTTLTYDAAGNVSKNYIQTTDGGTSLALYTNGVETSLAITATSGAKSYTVYASTGAMVSQSVTTATGDVTNTTYANGIKTSVNIAHADGSHENYAYGITGQTYTTQYQSFNASGHLLSLVRSHANGSLDSTETDSADGSKAYTYYTATGLKLTNVTVAADGTRTTLTYDAAGNVSKDYIQTTDGGTSLALYTNGVETSLAVTATSGAKSYTVYASNGSLVSQSATTAAGDVTNTTYANGIKTSVNIAHVDGSHENYAYGITGQTYTTQYQSFDTSSHLLSLVRSHADGSLDSTETDSADGSKAYTYYTATGLKLTNVQVAADGTRTTLTYDAAGNVSKDYIQTTDGGTSLALYTNGVETSLAVTATSGAKSYTVYGSTGAMVSQSATTAAGDVTNTTYANGIKTSVNIAHVDGSHENYAYGITGQTYTTQYQSFDTSGHLLSLVRSHADGSLDSAETDSADGSKAYSYYNSTGVKLTDVTAAADGTRTTLTYDTAGHLTKDYVQDTDGSTQTTLFTNGVKMSMAILHADGSSDYYGYNITGQTYTTQHQAIDASGKTVSLERDHADGSLAYLESYAADGTKSVSNYDATGHVLSLTTTHADLSSDVLTYMQDGTGDVRDQIYNSSKVMQTLDYRHTDGTHTTTAYTDSQTLHGSSGNDTFYLYANDEKVSFTGGHDTVYSFNATAPTVDHVVISTALAHSFADLTLTQSGGDVLVTVDHDNSILIAGTQLANVHSDMFLFG